MGRWGHCGGSADGRRGRPANTLQTNGSGLSSFLPVVVVVSLTTLHENKHNPSTHTHTHTDTLYFSLFTISNKQLYLHRGRLLPESLSLFRFASGELMHLFCCSCCLHQCLWYGDWLRVCWPFWHHSLLHKPDNTVYRNVLLLLPLRHCTILLQLQNNCMLPVLSCCDQLRGTQSSRKKS